MRMVGQDYFLPITAKDPNAEKIQPLGLGKDHLDTTLAAIKWICEVAGRLSDGVTYRKEEQSDGSTVFLGTPTEDSKVKVLVKNLKKSWDLGGASSVSCATFEPTTLQAAYRQIEDEANEADWETNMRAYICVRCATHHLFFWYRLRMYHHHVK